jgi:hypothetical protein
VAVFPDIVDRVVKRRRIIIPPDQRFRRAIGIEGVNVVFDADGSELIVDDNRSQRLAGVYSGRSVVVVNHLADDCPLGGRCDGESS